MLQFYIASMKLFQETQKITSCIFGESMVHSVISLMLLCPPTTFFSLLSFNDYYFSDLSPPISASIQAFTTALFAEKSRQDNQEKNIIKYLHSQFQEPRWWRE